MISPANAVRRVVPSILIAAGSSTGNGPFSADTAYASGGGSYTLTTSPPPQIDTSGISNPPPQSLFLTERYDSANAAGSGFTYTIPGLTPNASYNVRLDFSENYLSYENARTFDVAINGNRVLASFDIYKAAGDHQFKAVAPSFNSVANASGQITITFTTVISQAIVNGIEVTPLSPILIAAGSSTGNGPFSADTAYASGGGSYTLTTSPPPQIDTSGISNPPPQSLFLTERYDSANAAGSGFTYTIPGLTPNASYNVRLDFSENYLSYENARTFDVAINGNRVLASFDIYKAAGDRQFRAVAPSFTATSNASGQITITFTTVISQAIVNGIEVTPSPPGAIAIAAGSSTGNGPFSADTAYASGGGSYTLTTIPASQIDTSGISNPPPQSLFLTERYDSANAAGSGFTYTIRNLTPNAAYRVRLDFSENYLSYENARTFDVAINGTRYLAGFDIFKAAGDRQFKAVARTFTVNPDASGQITITFTTVISQAIVNGIEVTP